MHIVSTNAPSPTLPLSNPTLPLRNLTRPLPPQPPQSCPPPVLAATLKPIPVVVAAHLLLVAVAMRGAMGSGPQKRSNTVRIIIHTVRGS